METATITADPIIELVAVRDQLRAEADRLDGVIRRLQVAESTTQQQIAQFALGEQLGASKLARYLGCGRTHATSLLSGELAGIVHTRPNGTRWVARTDVDAWLTGSRRRLAAVA